MSSFLITIDFVDKKMQFAQYQSEMKTIPSTIVIYLFKRKNDLRQHQYAIIGRYFLIQRGLSTLVMWINICYRTLCVVDVVNRYP